MRRERQTAVNVLMSLAVLAVSSAAQGAIIEHTFTGEFENVTGGPPPPWQDTMVGSVFRVRYWFDSETPDLNDSQVGGLYDALALTVSIDGFEEQGTNLEIEVRNGLIGGIEDHIVKFDAMQGTVRGVLILSAVGFLESDALLTDFALADWNLGAGFVMGDLPGSGLDFNMGAFVTTFSSRIVPAPSCAAVLLILGFRGRRRTRRR